MNAWPPVDDRRTLNDWLARGRPAGNGGDDAIGGELPAFTFVEADGTVDRLTRAALFTRASAFGDAFRAAGLPRQGVLFVLLPSGPDQIAAFLGAMMAGQVPAILAPLTDKQNPDHHRATLRELFRQVDPAAVVVAGATHGQLPDTSCPVIRAETVSSFVQGDRGNADRADAAVFWPAARPEETAFLQFSSGTTGMRKGTLIRHDMVVAQLTAFQAALRLDGRRHTIASWLPLYHDMGLLATFVLPLALGVPVVCMDPMAWVRSPWLLFDMIERHRATHCWMPNFAFLHLCQTVPPERSWDLGGMEAFVSCSEPCKPVAFDRFVERFGTMGIGPHMLATSYAMAEAVFAVTQSAPGVPVRRLTVNRHALRMAGIAVELPAGMSAPQADPQVEPESLLSCGTALPGFSIRIVDSASGEIRPDGAVGEIHLAGPCLFAGYLGNLEATDAALSDGWFATGDLGFLHDGHLYVTGRCKDVIIVNGRNHHAFDIEMAVSAVPGLRPGRAVALPEHNPEVGSEQVLILAETDLPEEEHRALRRRVRQVVSDALGLTAVRVDFVPPQWLIKTSSGKMSRSENAARYRARQEGACGRTPAAATS